MTSHTIITSVRQIMQVNRPAELDVQTELAFIRSTLSSLETFAHEPSGSSSKTAKLIFDCYWVYVEKVDKRVKDLESIGRNIDNGLAFLRWDRGLKLWQSRDLVKKFWIFNQSLLSTLTLLGL